MVVCQMKTEAEIEQAINDTTCLISYAMAGAKLDTNPHNGPIWKQKLHAFSDVRQVLEWVVGRADSPFPAFVYDDAMEYMRSGRE